MCSPRHIFFNLFFKDISASRWCCQLSTTASCPPPVNFRLQFYEKSHPGTIAASLFTDMLRTPIIPNKTHSPARCGVSSLQYHYHAYTKLRPARSQNWQLGSHAGALSHVKLLSDPHVIEPSVSLHILDGTNVSYLWGCKILIDVEVRHSETQEFAMIKNRNVWPKSPTPIGRLQSYERRTTNDQRASKSCSKHTAKRLDKTRYFERTVYHPISVSQSKMKNFWAPDVRHEVYVTN